MMKMKLRKKSRILYIKILTDQLTFKGTIKVVVLFNKTNRPYVKYYLIQIL